MYTLHKKPEQPKPESPAKKHPDFNETEMKAIRAGLNDRIHLFTTRLEMFQRKKASHIKVDPKEVEKVEQRRQFCTELRDKINDFLGNDGIADY